jgi:hypothetical protein
VKTAGSTRDCVKPKEISQDVKKKVPGARGFTNAVHGLVELADETIARGGRNMITLKLLHVDVRGHVNVEESPVDIHLFYLKIVKAGKREKNTKSGVPDYRGEHGGVIEILHVATGNEAGLVLDNSSGAVAFNLVLP